MSSASRIVVDCPGIASSIGPSIVSMAATVLRWPGRQDDDRIAGAPGAAGDLARVAAVVVVLVRHRADHPLHREPAVGDVQVGGELDRLEVVEERRPGVPRHRLGPLDDVVALQSRDRDHRRVVHVQLRGELGEVAHDLVEALLRVVDEIHLVDGVHDVRQLEHRDDVRVAARLLDHALARVDEDHRDVRGRCAGDHVARVLHVTGRVGELEAAPRRDERAVRDVDRDPLLALGTEAVGEQREVDVVVAAASRRVLDVLELVDQDLLRVVEQPADQRRLAVVDRAGGDEAKKVCI